MILKIAALAVCLGSLLFQSKTTFLSGGTHIVLTGYQTGKMDDLKSGEKHVDLSGDLAQIQALEKGFTTRGKELEFTWAELDAKTTEFRKGRIEGNAVLVYDSDAAQKVLVAEALANKKTLPISPTESSFIQLHSELFTYEGNVDRGTVTMPVPWKLKDVAKGFKMKTKEKVAYKANYDQTFDMSGSKGVFSIIKGPDGNLGKIEKGSFEGPVHFKITRHETPDGTTLTETSTYTGVADHLDIDLTTKPGTITAHGHVVVDADTTTMKAQFVDDEFLLYVDEKLEPVKLKFSGAPGKTTANTKDGIH